jgi:glutamate-1-semialdehyde 2,1-aminomutase
MCCPTLDRTYPTYTMLLALVLIGDWLATQLRYLPEHLVAAADRHGLTITLHMVRQRALSDPENQKTIRDYCLRYPRMKLILAHLARGFNMHHTINGLDALRGLDNV